MVGLKRSDARVKSTPLEALSIAEIVERVPLASELLETINITIAKTDENHSFIHYLERQFPLFYRAVQNNITVKELHQLAHQSYQQGRGIFDLLALMGYAEEIFDKDGLPKNPQNFYPEGAHDYIDLFKHVCLLQGDLLNTQVACQDYDGPGVSESEHAKQAGILAFYGVDARHLFEDRKLLGLRIMAGFFWHDIYRLVQPDRISAHSTHHIFGERMLALFGQRVSVVTKFHTAAKLMLARTRVTDDIMTQESVASAPYQSTDEQVKIYRESFLDRDNIEAACYFAVTARLFGDDFAKLSRDCLSYADCLNPRESAAISAVLIKHAFQEAALLGGEKAFIEGSLKTYFNEVKAHNIKTYSSHPVLYNFLSDSAFVSESEEINAH